MDTTPIYAPYKNRWLVLLNKRVIGVGRHAHQALRAAQTHWPKTKQLQLIYVDDLGLATMQPQNFDIWFQSKLLRQVTKVLQKQNQPAYLVGGAVRDGLLGQPKANADLDLVVPTGGCKVAKTLADKLRAAYYPIDAKRDVGRVVFADKNHIDIAAYRGGSLAEDLRLRDFTVNAIALALSLDDP